LPTALMVAISVAVVTLAVRKTFPDDLSDRRAWQILAGCIAVVVISQLVAFFRRLPPRAGTVALDRHHDLHDRLTSAIAFDATGPAEASPRMEVAIDDACAHASQLKPSKALPIRAPSDLPGALLACAGMILVALLYVPKRPVIVPQAKTIDALTMTP